MRINFKSVLTMTGVLIMHGFMACKEPAAKAEDAPSIQRPNIIYILADDLGYGDISVNGQQKFNTPNIDQLAKEGMLLTQHYSGSTVCAPSRSALLTGQHTGHTPIRGNKEVQPEGQHPMPDSCLTIAEMLKARNYVTGIFGKWGLGFPGSEGDPNRQGFDEFYGYNCQRLAHHYYPYHLWHNQEKIILRGNEGRQQNDYAPQLIHKEALQFLERNKDTTFFMFYASALPHAELLVEEEYMKRFKGRFLPEKSFQGTDDGPEYRNGPYGSQENGHAAFAAMIAVLDEQVGEIVAQLERYGIAENTLIMFSSDNGPHREGGADPDYFDSNARFRGYKRDLYEGGIRVPMIVRWKGKITAGSTSDHISAFWDVMPTLAELVDGKAPRKGDGISFLPTLLKRGKQKRHEYLYWEFHERGGRIAIRKGNWKGVKYNVLKEPGKTMELYELDTDPEESKDVASEHPEIVGELEALMQQARTGSPVFQFKSSTYLSVE